MKRLGCFALLMILLFGVIGCAISESVPQPSGYVNDFANLMSDESRKSLESQLVQYEKQTANEIAVVTVKTIGDNSTEEYGIKLADKWKVGKKDKDNGIIILIAEKERKIRIEVGYGLEPVLTDAKAKRIIENEITPRFKVKDYEGGIRAGVNAIIATLEGSYSYNPAQAHGNQTESGGWPLWLILVLILGGTVSFLLFIAFIGAISDSGGGGYWSSGGSSGGGGSGGGFGGFGGGGFGGGGAGGSW